MAPFSIREAGDGDPGSPRTMPSEMNQRAILGIVKQTKQPLARRRFGGAVRIFLLRL
jgi:hypothetical protein